MADAAVPKDCPQCGDHRVARVYWDRGYFSAADRAAADAGRAILALSDRADLDRAARRDLPGWACRLCVPEWEEAHRYALQDYEWQLAKESAVAAHDFEQAGRLRDQQVLARPEWSALTGRLLRCLAPGLQTHLPFDPRWRTTDVVGLA
ncbi:MAG TPA: hypothetical protein VM597_35660 [Gemmataceae bacterium]|jgi:hypothetical protein|nr:hypothetical protein [Gemmataceae bacterium]